MSFGREGLSRSRYFISNINSDGVTSLDYPVFISSELGYQYAPILSGNIENGLFAIYGDRGAGSIDLKVQKIGLDYLPEWQGTGLVARMV